MNKDTNQTSFEQMQTLRVQQLNYVDHHAQMLHDLGNHLLSIASSGNLSEEESEDATTFAYHLNEVVLCAMFRGVLTIETAEYVVRRFGIELVFYIEQGVQGQVEYLVSLSEWMDELFGVDFNVYNTH
ncbi:hypothetical protein VCRA2113O120_330016 [Vibrio crassostreae]|uniref:hypothetical protein n=1 Tax=Vibrio crassostreae TaxID=246167 RepID=UPI001B3014B7|nr:hypothetical protein [Vibrio crassostreae]CAK1942144.1 hypothetical protein VCRA2114E123_290016 [Vibrio crassostreae]CAK1948215.1 hypothetical protein VCRA2114E122_290016 [Vibrio crassostreae]CAK2014404.1 hypothetical protein VCRA2113O120_330016 [Vibrio crassostreae]CAK2329201.1 hypothetical protein VCRA2112O114_330030 [Vibrio crassostreae]CAK2329702.1 hypothetical protein VCRA2112O115_330030 [Vibrio crassostreae]